MIFTVFIIVGTSILALLVGFLPASEGFSDEALTSMQGLSDYFYVFNELLAIDTLMICISLVIATELILIGFHLFRWMINMIPMIKV